MIDEKQCELQELSDEVEMILSVKDEISDEEILNLVNKFSLLSEYDIRQKIEELTKDHTYIQEFIEKVNEETSNIPVKTKENLKSETINVEITDNSKFNNYEEYLLKEETRGDNDSETKKEIDELVENGEIKKDTKQQYEQIEKKIFDEDNIPEVCFVKAEIKYGQLSLEWGWPTGIDKVLLCYRMDQFPSSPKDSCASQIIIRRENGVESGGYIIQNIIEGNYYFSIYTSSEYGENIVFSQGQRRLVVNKAPSEIFYEIKAKRNLLGKLKSAELILSTKTEELNLPQLILIGRLGNMPLQKSDGKSLFTTDYQTITKDKRISFNFPIENINRNMYVKLFFLDDINSKVYRIVSPAKEKLYFK